MEAVEAKARAKGWGGSCCYWMLCSSTSGTAASTRSPFTAPPCCEPRRPGQTQGPRTKHTAISGAGFVPVGQKLIQGHKEDPRPCYTRF
jgi:hypothetical protein